MPATCRYQAALPDGRVAAFSVLANGYRGGAERAMDGIDRFAAELVGGGTEKVAQERPTR